MKKCSKCKIEKPNTEFSKNTKSNDGLQSRCKSCRSQDYSDNKDKVHAQHAAYYQANKNEISERRHANRDKINAYYASYWAANKEKICSRVARYYRNNKEAISVKKAKHRLLNIDYMRARDAAYYSANREKRREYKARFCAENRDLIMARGAKYYARNRESMLAKSANYRAENPEKFAEYRRNRRARKLNAEGKHTAADVLRIFEHQRGLCANCRNKLLKSGGQKYHVDHIVPLVKGGSNWPSNLQCLCPTCNLRKQAKDPIVWAKQNGRLL